MNMNVRRPSGGTLTHALMPPHAFPEQYAMVCDGDCMFPLYEHGQRLVFSKSAPLKPGQPVLLFRKPEATPPGENPMLFKQLVSGPSKAYWEAGRPPIRGNVRPVVTVRMLNPPRTLFFPADDLLGVHSCTGVLPMPTLEG